MALTEKPTSEVRFYAAQGDEAQMWSFVGKDAENIKDLVNAHLITTVAREPADRGDVDTDLGEVLINVLRGHMSSS